MVERHELPAAVDTEKRLLNLMLTKGESLPLIIDALTAEEFYREEHRLIFRAIVDIYNEGSSPDTTLIFEKLTKRGEDDRVSRMYVFSLTNYNSASSSVEKYIKIIKEKFFLRNVIYACEELLEAAYDQTNEANFVLELLEQKFLAITTKTDNKVGFESLGDITQRSFKKIQYLHEHPDEVNGVPTGLADLDKITNGLHNADLILLAARPSMGKTALALNIAANTAKKSKRIVALFSLEMNKEQLGNRFLSTASNVNSMYLNTGNLSDGDMNSLIESAEDMPSLKIYIDDTPGLSIIDIRSKIRKMRHERGGLDLIIIDYLQLMQGSRSKYSEQNRQQEISEISRGLKALAREMNVPILALSQLSRQVEQRAEKKPQLSDLRESGSLEQDADMVMFLYRDEYYNRDDSDNENIAELIIAKNRNGPTTSIRLQFQKEIMRFGDLTRVEM